MALARRAARRSAGSAWGGARRPEPEQEVQDLIADGMLSYHRLAEIHEQVMARELAPLFGRALALRGDAWVCVNDMEAVQALRFLRQNRVRVPGDLRLVSFDNTDDALYHGLTSYEFDVRGMALAMLDRVLRPNQQPASTDTSRVVTHSGVVIGRGSSCDAGPRGDRSGRTGRLSGPRGV